MEAQRYPEDFDGIVAAAPVASFTQFAATCLKNAQATFPNPSELRPSVVTPENLTLLQAATLTRCDVLDGVKDGVIDDPRACVFRVADLPACPEDRPGRDCLTRAQRVTVERIYAPASQQNLPGLPFGGVDDPSGWKEWISGINDSLYASTKGSAPSLQWKVGVDFFRYFVFDDPSRDYSRYALSRWERDTQRIAPFLDATSSDLSAFKARNGKLIISHGWSDPAITALASVGYYTQVESRDPAVRSYFQLFMLPGVGHCNGGPGPEDVDWFGAIADWVERGLAPERLIAAKVADNGKTIRTRPVCPYPQRAAYTGQGSTDDAGNFVCRTP
jgi:Tannase and feruloyl esterase